MSQKFHNLLDMLLNNSNWAADWNKNALLIADRFRTFKMTITVQGSHTSPSTVKIQIQDSTGILNILENYYLRVRVADNTGYANATHAAIAAGSGTTLVETLTSSKDLVFKSDSNGVITLTCTDTTIETFALLIGEPTMGAQIANYNNSLNVTHA